MRAGRLLIYKKVDVFGPFAKMRQRRQMLGLEVLLNGYLKSVSKVAFLTS